MSSIEQVKERCEGEIEEKQGKMQGMTVEIEEGKDELKNLKSQLYSKFGDAIRLDYD